MFQPEGFAELARAIKEKSDKNIWCYTGYTFEKLLEDPRQCATRASVSGAAATSGSSTYRLP